MRILSVLLLSSALVPVSALAAERVERAVQASADTSLVSSIVIEIPASALIVTTHADRSVVVEGIATRTYRGERNRQNALDLVNEAGVSLTRRGAILYVERDLGSGGRFWKSPNATQYELDILVPAGVAIELRQNAGDIDLEGEFGDLDVRLGAGELTLTMPERLMGELDASTTVGELHTDLGSRIVEKSGVLAGSTSFVNPAGSSRVRLRVRAGSIDVKLTE